MWLTTEDLGDRMDIDADELDAVFAADDFGKFAILNASEEAFLQTANVWEATKECKAFLAAHDSDPWILEYREDEQQFQAVGNLTLDQVRQAMQWYLACDETWRSAFTWEELEL